MPELPEVECLVRYIRGGLPSAPVVGVSIEKPRIIRDDISMTPGTWGSRLHGMSLVTIGRRGKFLQFQFVSDQGETEMVAGHLGMTGRIFWDGGSGGNKHTHEAARLQFESGDDLVMVDPRTFGKLSFRDGMLESLAIDPVSPDWSGYRWPDAVRRSQTPVKNIIMNQKWVSGVGNIYASEALFDAGIHPLRRGSSLTGAEWKRLKVSLTRVLEKGIEKGASLKIDFSGRSPNRLFYFGVLESEKGSEKASLENEFMVYDRGGQECPQCGETLAVERISSRSSYFCPGCQPELGGRN